ncbi:MAG: hypothetical protein M1833_003448 [Piccolia ochrophora]|nr:MAG: hypothetical protein M1833_003448 [Piccolia ochrophora]
MSRMAFSTAPLVSSPLRNPSGPSSPALPLTPPASRPVSPVSSFSSFSSVEGPIKRPDTPPNPPPTEPLAWLWTCHLCHSVYSLGTTRRCLQDGHYFCSGTTYDKRSGTTRRHTSCNSEFDYVGWSTWQEWRRDSLGQQEAPSVGKDCWHQCDYPSECRWGSRVGVKSKKQKTKSESKRPELTRTPKMEDLSTKTREDIVDQVVDAVQKNSEKGLWTAKGTREEELLLSPLKQHYRLPRLDSIAEEDSSMELFDGDKDGQVGSSQVDSGTIAVAISLDDLDAGISDSASGDLTSPTPEMMDDDSDISSSESASPPAQWELPVNAGFDFGTAKSLSSSLLPPSSFKRSHLRTRSESLDSGYGSEDEDDLEDKVLEMEMSP